MREILQRRRRDILEARDAARAELHALQSQERDPEFEENAQIELADYTLSHLIENMRKELILIDAAFQRLDMNVFGECVDCGREISIERLEALPFAIRCEDDARRHEHEMKGGEYATPSL